LSKPTLEQDLEALFEKTGKVDHIVFTAGDRLATTSLAESTLESIQRAGQIRFFAPLLVAKVGRKYLTGGAQSSIVLTTGSVADRPVPNVSLQISPPPPPPPPPLITRGRWSRGGVRERLILYSGV